MADADADGSDLVASFFTLTGAGFGEEPRHSFASAAGRRRPQASPGSGCTSTTSPRTVASGLDVAGMQAVLADTGLRVVEIEFLGGWALDADPAELERTVAPDRGGRGRFRWPARQRRGVPRRVPLDLDAAASRLDVLARRLAGRGLQVAVEAFPWSALAGPTTVPELLRQGQAPNVGQLVDVWHFFNNGGTPDAVTGPIAAVQLNDGPRVHADFLRHARAARRLPVRASWTSSACCGPCSAPASPARGASRSTPRSSAHYPSTRPPAGPQRRHQRRSTRRTHRGHGPDLSFRCVPGLSAGGDDSAAQGFFLVDDLVDLVGGPAGAVGGTRTTPSESPTMMSPAEMTTPPTATGSDDAGAVLEGAGGGGGAGEDDQALRGEGFGVADRAVDDGAEDALGDHDLADQVADQGSAEVALAVDDQDVAGLGVVEGAVDGEVVPGSGQDRQGGADEPGCGW